LKAVREKKQITYKGKPIKITANFSTETLKARRVALLHPANFHFEINKQQPKKYLLIN
jgi:hypothetical protein